MNEAIQQTALSAGEFRLNRGDAWGQLARARLASFYAHIGVCVCEDDTAADFGGNDGWTAEYWQEITHTSMLVIDGLEEPLAAARRSGLRTCRAELEHLPLADASIDWGFCSHTLEHCEDLDLAIAELYRVTRRAVMVIVPLEDDELVKKNSSHQHHNPDPLWWENKLKAAGFILKWRKDGRNDFDAIYLCFKPEFFDEWNDIIQARMHTASSHDEITLHHAALDARITRLGAVMRGAAQATWIDFGGGDGASKRFFTAAVPGSTITVVDACLDAHPDIVAYAENVPVADSSYDWGFCSHVLEHVRDPLVVLQEMYRVARKGAWVVVPLQSAHEAAGYISHITHSDDVKFWFKLFELAGFRVRYGRVEYYFNNLKELDCWLVKP